MSTDQWIPIRYRDFYDIPRAFVIEAHGRHFFFDCPFDDVLDDYPDRYAIYSLDPSVVAELETISWSSLSERGQHLGDLSIHDVEFEPTRRRFVNGSVMQHLDQI